MPGPAAAPRGATDGGPARFLPIAGWLPGYERAWLRADLVAGVSVWALLVPQGMAYASVAGVPAQYGLYAGFGAVIAYALFGTSRQVVSGPSATVAVVSASVVGTIAAAGSPLWPAYTAALALSAGAVFVVLGLLRAGWISNFLSRAVMAGFVFAFGIGLIIDQSYKVLGVPKVSGSYAQQLVAVIRELPQIDPPTLAVGGSAVVLLLLMRRFLPKWPRALVAVVLGVLAVPAFGLAEAGVRVVGRVPVGVPSLALPRAGLGGGTVTTLLIGGVAVFLVGLSESLASARETAEKHDYAIDASQEMVAQGGANLASGLLGGFAVDGSLSKTGVADAAGQKSQMASLVTGGLILLTVLFLAGLFANLPEALLGAVVIDAAVGLVDLKALARFFATDKTAFAAYSAAALGLLFIGVLAGIAIGAFVSLLLLVSSASKSPVRRMQFDPDDETFVEEGTCAKAVEPGGVLVAEIEGPLFYADAAEFQSAILDMALQDPRRGVVIDLGPATTIDIDGADALTKVHRRLSGKGMGIALARVERGQLGLLRTAGTLDEIGEDKLFPTVRAAVAALGGTLGRPQPVT